MSFFDYFRNFFGAKQRDEPGTSGLGDHYSHRDRFRNPIWEYDEDDDDMDDFRRPRMGMHFHVFSDPFEITRYFESQMDAMLKSFGFGNDFHSFSDGFIGALPPAEERGLREGNSTLRERMLKPELDSSLLTPDRKEDTDLDGNYISEAIPAIPLSLLRQVRQSSNSGRITEKKASEIWLNVQLIPNTVLDFNMATIRLTKDDFSKIWHGSHEGTTSPPVSHSFSFGKSIKKEFIRRPDGTLEQKQVIRDSEGNQETIVTREAGDKKYIVTTKTDKYGVETKSEDLINMDENELKDFNKKWTRSIKDKTDGQDSDLNRFRWDKFFGPWPKL